MVDELAPGPTLRRRLESLLAAGERMQLDEASALARQVALAVDEARRQGKPHAAVMPDYIALAPEASEGLPYRPVLLSPGEAPVAAALAYISPEQAIGEPADARSDAYSLGVLLYELATGQPPFAVATLAEAIRHHGKEPPPPPRALRPDLPEALEQVILRALQKDPAARFADGAALAAALSALQAPAAAPAEPLGEPTGDVITAVAPDGSVHSFACRSGVMRIGRSADNDLVLDYAGVEAQHARLHVDARGCRVESTSEAGETCLGSDRLAPGLVELWAPNRLLRIGSVRMHLDAAPRPTAAPAPPPPPATAPPTPIAQPPGPRRGRVGLWLAVGAGVVLVGAIAALAILWRPSGGPGPTATVPTPRPTTPRPPATVPATVEPTAPPAEVPTPGPPAGPSPTPTVCVAAGARFAAAYAAQQAEIGCPRAAPVETWMAVERFEHGLMLWCQDSAQIYVLTRTGADALWGRFDDTWAEGLPDRDPALVPPAGLEQPVRGFGKVWREQLGGPASKIGWATQPEQGFDGARQRFANGLLIAGPGGETYALFADGRWEGP